MDTYIPDAYCGLYCGACEILQAYKRARESGRDASWDDLPQQVYSHIMPAEVRCSGCKTNNVFEGCLKCKIRLCARNKNLDFCSNCLDFPCELTRQMSETISRITHLLPHAAGIIHNLDEIISVGKAKWLENQKRKWSCSFCGAEFSWYQNKCHVCDSS